MNIKTCTIEFIKDKKKHGIETQECVLWHVLAGVTGDDDDDDEKQNKECHAIGTF